jgi:hypothetical protein
MSEGGQPPQGRDLRIDDAAHRRMVNSIMQQLQPLLAQNLESHSSLLHQAVQLGLVKAWTCPECSFLNRSYPSICERCSLPNVNYRPITAERVIHLSQHPEILSSEQSLERFEKDFPHWKTHRPLLPVIHVETLEQTLRNITKAKNCGADGVFLINHGLKNLHSSQKIGSFFSFLFSKKKKNNPEIKKQGFRGKPCLRFLMQCWRTFPMSG